MEGEVEATFWDYTSPSEYAVHYESIDGPIRSVPYRLEGSLNTYRLRPGDYFYVNWYWSDEDNRVVLIRVPDDEYEFAKFRHLASRPRDPVAPAIWADKWILDYAVKTWVLNEADSPDEDEDDVEDEADDYQRDYPLNLMEALHMYMWQGKET